MWLQWCDANAEHVQDCGNEHARADGLTSENVKLQEELQYATDGELDRYEDTSE